MNKEELMNVEHKFKPYRKLMDKEKMAAQFLPFAALTGFDQIIIESAKRKVKQKILLDDKKEELNRKLNYLCKIPNAYIEVTYYQFEKLKEGGEYITKKGNIKKVDRDNKCIIFKDKTIVCFKYIRDIKSTIFDFE